ncbi:hypothetical protein SYYSPA8_13495 [Streptomyces yaizuensis]|uniref:Uncharacterized protein n=1 Tax=Streptomyces yaizuensis TaxID=2989713 RepID=A0ABQ5NYT1_9ACTN|nr:hypothetical protein [Streptomyces sp. YSPA8]GLF95318.1 hypothetical protein SYYSPA8_13495 [Streptomyces sp. YSPA8]
MSTGKRSRSAPSNQPPRAVPRVGIDNPFASYDEGRSKTPVDHPWWRPNRARLSPLQHRDLNLLGRSSFAASTAAAGTLRPLRDPDAPERHGRLGGARRLTALRCSPDKGGAENVG